MAWFLSNRYAWFITTPDPAGLESYSIGRFLAKVTTVILVIIIFQNFLVIKSV